MGITGGHSAIEDPSSDLARQGTLTFFAHPRKDEGLELKKDRRETWKDT